MKKPITITASLFILGLIAWRLHANQQFFADKRAQAMINIAAYPVEVAITGPGTISKTYRADGRLEPIHRVSVVSESSGKVVGHRGKTGSSVKARSRLVTIDQEIAEMRMSAAKAAHKQAKIDLVRTRELVQADAIPKQQLENLILRETELATQYRLAKREFENCKITAPITGILHNYNIDRGDYINRGTVICEILALDRVKINTAIPRRALRGITVGDTVSVQISGTSIPRSGEVTAVSWATNSSGKYPVEISINNSDMELRSGEMATVTFSQTHEEPLLIPRKALVLNSAVPFIYKVENGSSVPVNIEYTETFGEMLPVTAGLNPGDTVITAGQINLTHGTPVVIR